MSELLIEGADEFAHLVLCVGEECPHGVNIALDEFEGSVAGVYILHLGFRVQLLEHVLVQPELVHQSCRYQRLPQVQRLLSQEHVR
jgi:hypothetical protein